MIFIIAMVIAVVSAFIIIRFFIEDTYMNAIGATLTYLFGIPMVVLVTGIIMFGVTALTFIPASTHQVDSKDTSEYLQAIRMDNATGGTFFLGSGVIDEDNVFTYYAKNKNGSFHSGRIYADYADIIESDTERPRIVTHHWYFSRWIIPFGVQDGFDINRYSYTVYVPKGSIKPITDLSFK